VLTGSELLAKVKELGDVSKSDLVRECGYVSTKADGSDRLNFTAFYEALLEAKGLNLGGGSKGSRPGRSLSYITRVQFNGNLLVGKAYTAMLGLNPGDEFEIKLGKKAIRLVPMQDADFENGDPENDILTDAEAQDEADTQASWSGESEDTTEEAWEEEETAPAK
jgi:hypothetical protein